MNDAARNTITSITEELADMVRMFEAVGVKGATSACAEIVNLRRHLEATKRAHATALNSAFAHQAENVKLEAMLEKYGQHVGTCPFRPGFGSVASGRGLPVTVSVSCTCGFDEPLVEDEA